MNQQSSMPAPLLHFSAYDVETNDLHVIIETPKNSRNKFNYDEKLGIFKLGGVLPAGAAFPYDFGFIPETIGGDGDPLDVLLLMDEPAFTGCLVAARLVGVIEAEQTEEDRTDKNDRLIAVASESRNHKDVRSLTDINKNLVDEIEHFFISYNAARSKEFKPTNRSGPERATALVKEGIKRFHDQEKSGAPEQNDAKAK